MDYRDFTGRLKLDGRVVGITRGTPPAPPPKLSEACTLAALNRALQGETVWVTMDNGVCHGSATGMGLTDEAPPVPGGFGYFLSCGRGAGFPVGERVKLTPELGEAMLQNQPKDVMGGHSAVRLAPYETGGEYDTVTVLANPDQLSVLVTLFTMDTAAYDNVILPMSSGCASVFRIPFGELKRGSAARAVVGNVDVFSRPHFPQDTFFFTVPAAAFARMLRQAEQSILVAPVWRGVEKRL